MLPAGVSPARVSPPERPAAMPVGGAQERDPRLSPAVVDHPLPPARRASGRASDDEPGLEQLLLERALVTTAPTGEQEADGLLALPADRLVDGGERWIGELGDVDVVVADDREVLRGAESQGPAG